MNSNNPFFVGPGRIELAKDAPHWPKLSDEEIKRLQAHFTQPARHIDITMTEEEEAMTIPDSRPAGKQRRYQDTKGEDWIDEAARTFTAEEFRGAMRFSIGKYNRRMGKKDELIAEIEKMRDYCERWLKVEKARP